MSFDWALADEELGEAEETALLQDLRRRLIHAYATLAALTDRAIEAHRHGEWFIPDPATRTLMLTWLRESHQELIASMAELEIPILTELGRLIHEQGQRLERELQWTPN